MELARALTHRKRPGSDSHYVGPARAQSTRAGPIKRSAISNPVQLISTTNALAYSAPNIYPSSASSADESDSSISLGVSSRATTPETTPAESPIEPNHLSCYFPSQNRMTTRTSKESMEVESPVPPQRAPSHTKKSHQVAARQRASSRATPPPSTIHMSPPLHASFEVISSKTLSDHPFGAELAQVNEVAERYGARSAMLDEEEQFLINHGLCKFGAKDYVDEISNLFGGGSNNPFSPFTPIWI